jgi:hypothetical protein
LRAVTRAQGTNLAAWPRHGRSANPIDYLYQQIQTNAARQCHRNNLSNGFWELPNKRSNADRSLEAENIFTMSNSVATKPPVGRHRREILVLRKTARSLGCCVGHRLPSHRNGGAGRDRTDDLLLAKQALSQLSYGPKSHPNHAGPGRMVGPGRFELPTSRLSGVRSNQLSYGPPCAVRHAPRDAPATGIASGLSNLTTTKFPANPGSGVIN